MLLFLLFRFTHYNYVMHEFSHRAQLYLDTLYASKPPATLVKLHPHIAHYETYHHESLPMSYQIATSRYVSHCCENIHIHNSSINVSERFQVHIAHHWIGQNIYNIEQFLTVLYVHGRIHNRSKRPISCVKTNRSLPNNF